MKYLSLFSGIGGFELGIRQNYKTVNISDTQRYKTLGNAVTVNVIREIIKRIICKT